MCKMTVNLMEILFEGYESNRIQLTCIVHKIESQEILAGRKLPIELPF